MVGKTEKGLTTRVGPSEKLGLVRGCAGLWNPHFDQQWESLYCNIGSKSIGRLTGGIFNPVAAHCYSENLKPDPKRALLEKNSWEGRADEPASFDAWSESLCGSSEEHCASA